MESKTDVIKLADFSKAIIETTATYSHVGIYFDGMIYHASRKLGVAK